MADLERLDLRIHVIRGVRVMLDADLAKIYGVQTKTLNRAVARNGKRFPERYMFRLTQQEFINLRYQIGTSSLHGGRRIPPYAFTEHGAVMLASVLNSSTAIAASIQVVDAFIRLRQAIDANKTLAKKVEELGARVTFHDKAIAILFEEIQKLAEPPPEKPKGRIGFHKP